MLAFVIKGQRKGSESEMSMSEKRGGREFGEADTRKEEQEFRKELEGFLRVQVRSLSPAQKSQISQGIWW